MKRPWTLIAIGVAGLLLAPVVVPLFVPWTGINCRSQEINIKTGHARYARFLWFVKISERVEETTLSLALQGATVDVAEIKEWHRVNTFSPWFQHSPHYAFHGALNQIRQLEAIEELEKVEGRESTPERKREIASQIMTSWQHSGGDSGAKAILYRLSQETFSE